MELRFTHASDIFGKCSKPRLQVAHQIAHRGPLRVRSNSVRVPTPSGPLNTGRTRLTTRPVQERFKPSSTVKISSMASVEIGNVEYGPMRQLLKSFVKAISMLVFEL